MITFNLSISKKYQDYFDKLIMMAGISSVPVSTLIHKGIKMYVDDVPKLVCDPILWDDMISKMSDEQRKETNTLLLQLIQTIVDNNDSIA